MTPERPYRLLTLAYPRRWRREHADELVGSLLDLAEQEGRRRPAARDVLDVLGHGLACRARTPVAALPVRTRSVAGTLGLASGSALAAVLLAADRPVPVGPALYAAWLLALAAALTGPGWLRRALLAGVTAAGAAVPAVTEARPSLTILGFLAACGLLALLDPRERPGRDLLLPTAAAAALTAGPLLAYRPDADLSFYYGRPHQALGVTAVLVLGLLAAALVALAARGSGAAAAGVALAALPWLLVGLAPSPAAVPVLAGVVAAALLGTAGRSLGLRVRVERVR